MLIDILFSENIVPLSIRVNIQTLSGFLYFFRGLGNIVGPLVVGTLYDTTNSYAHGCYMSAGSLIVASILNELAHLIFKLSKTVEIDLQCK